jgi:hypothetical protein
MIVATGLSHSWRATASLKFAVATVAVDGGEL